MCSRGYGLYRRVATFRSGGGCHLKVWCGCGRGRLWITALPMVSHRAAQLHNVCRCHVARVNEIDNILVLDEGFVVLA